MINVLLRDIQERLTAWRTVLFKYNKELVSMNRQMETFRKDAILTALMSDSAFIKLYAAELADLKDDWQDAEKSTDTTLNTINSLQATLSTEYFETIDLVIKTEICLEKQALNL